MSRTIVVRAERSETIEAQWGGLTWYASGPLGNSQKMTVGKCVIHPGAQNPRHSHPNCEEVLVVMQGTISHTVEDDKDVILQVGDTIRIPEGLPHRALNIGTGDAVLFIVFSSAHRKTDNE